MNWRRILLTGILAAGLAQASLPFVSTAWADNDHDHHWYHDHWTDRDHDHDRWWREHHESDHIWRVLGPVQRATTAFVELLGARAAAEPAVTLDGALRPL